MSNKLGVNLTLVLAHIASYGDGDIDDSAVELRFEDENGRDTGCDVDIREVCAEAYNVIEEGFKIPPGYALVPIGKELADGGVAQKAFWHALEFCNDPEERNIRSHWETYKVLLSSRQEPWKDFVKSKAPEPAK